MLSVLYTRLLTFSFLSLCHSSWALRNVTLDDTDPSITWVGTWTTVPPGFSNPVGGSYRTTTDPEAYAEFKFTGIGIHFASPRFPAVASTALILDNVKDSPVVVNLEDYETKTTDKEFGQSKILASAIMLEPTEHTIRVKMGGKEGYGVFDAFIYTEIEDGDEPGPATISITGFTTVAPAPVLSDASSSPGESPSPHSSTSYDSLTPSNSPLSLNSSPSSNSGLPYPPPNSGLPSYPRSQWNASAASNSPLPSGSPSSANALLPSAVPEEESSSISLPSSMITALLPVVLIFFALLSS